MAEVRDSEFTDALIAATLNAVPDDRWDEIGAAVDAVMRETEHLQWQGGQRSLQVINGMEREVTAMPYPVYSEAVERLRGALGALVIPFPWSDWDGVHRYRAGSGMAEAPVADAVRMITAVLRSERFSDGSIGGAIDDGTLIAAVARVRTWREEEQR